MYALLLNSYPKKMLMTWFKMNHLGQTEHTKRQAKGIRHPLHTRRKRRCAYEQKRICQPILTNCQHDVRPTGDPVRKKMLPQTLCNSYGLHYSTACIHRAKAKIIMAKMLNTTNNTRPIMRRRLGQFRLRCLIRSSSLTPFLFSLSIS